MGIPFYYDELNKMRGLRIPSSLNYSSEAFYYFERALYQRLISKFNFKVPEHWDKDIFVCELVMLGFVGIFDTNKYAKGDASKMYGIIPEPATLTGIGVQFQPTKIRTANHAFYMPDDEIIYQGAGLVRISPDYQGLMDIIDFYAKKFALLSGSIDQAFINERFSFIAWANTKAGAETLKAIFDKRNSGEPFVVFNKDNLKKVEPTVGEAEPFGFINCEVDKNYISDKLLRDFRTLLNMFDAEIGIANNPTEKAERMISNEVESNSVETVARFTTWMECLQRSIEKTKKVFPDLELSVEATVYDTGQTGAVEAAKGGVDYGLS